MGIIDPQCAYRDRVVSAHILATHWPQLGPIGPWISASCYGMILGTFIVSRFLRGRWKLIDLAR